MMRASCAKYYATITMLLTALPVAAATLSPLQAPPYIMSTASDQTTLPVPLIVPPGTADVCLRLGAVSWKQNNDKVLSDHFDVNDKLSVKTGVPTLLINIKNVHSLRPGEYQLIVVPCGKEDAFDPLRLTLTRPAVKFETVAGKVTVDRWVAFFDRDVATRTVPATIELRPAVDNKGEHLRALTLRLENLVSGQKNTGVWQTSSARDVAVGGHVDVALDAGTLPVGVTDGQLALDSPDLDNRYVIPLQYRTRLHWSWIIWMVALGIVAGVINRVVFKHRQALATARAPALEALIAYRQQLDTIPDTGFADAIRVPLENLVNAVNKDDDAKINEVTTITKDAVAAAVQKLNEEISSASKAIVDLRNGYDVQSALPVQLGDVRDEALKELQESELLLRGRDPTRAQALIEATKRRTDEGLTKSHAELKLIGDTFVEQLGLVAVMLMPAAQTMLSARLVEWRASLSALSGPYQSDAKTFLRGASEVELNAKALLTWCAEELAKGTAKISALVDGRAAAGSLKTELDGFCQAADQLISAARSLPSPILSGPLRAQWTTHVGRAIDAGNELLQKLASLRADHAPDLNQPGANWIALLEGVPPLNSQLSADTAAATPATLPAPAQLYPQGGAAKVLIPSFDAFKLGSLESAVATNKLALFRADLGMATLVAILLAWASFAYMEDKFIGTWAELLALFFWGFTADLSAEKLAERITPAKVGP
jgi:hypothetical protein